MQKEEVLATYAARARGIMRRGQIQRVNPPETFTVA